MKSIRQPTVETIEETTVGFLGDNRVAMASMVFNGNYILPNGALAKGLTCVLVPVEPEGEKIDVGLGSVANIAGTRWQVVEIAKQPGKNGSITLKSAD